MAFRKIQRILCIGSVMCAWISAGSIGLANTTVLEMAPATSGSSPTTPALVISSPAESAEAGGSVEARRLELQMYLAKLHAKATKQRSRMAQLLGVISLAQFEGSPMTDVLLNTLEGSKDMLVREVAFEALYARAGSMDNTQKLRWLTTGMKIAEKEQAFRGAMIRPLLLACGSEAAIAAEATLTDEKLLFRIIAENDAANPLGKATLEAAAEALLYVSDPSLLRKLANRATADERLEPRVALVLSRFGTTPDSSLPASKRRAAWVEFAKAIKLPEEPPTAKQLKPDGMFKAPIVIGNPEEQQYRKDLEIQPLKLRDVDVVLAIDGTGSMEPQNTQLIRIVPAMMSLLEFGSDRSRIGAIYYRHEVDTKLMQPCCRKAQNQKDTFLNVVMPLTNNPEDLVDRMKAISPFIDQDNPTLTGHDGGNGAYAGMFQSVIQDFAWSKSPDAFRMLVVIGDANPTKDTAAAVVSMAHRVRSGGVQMKFIITRAPSDVQVGPMIEAAGTTRQLLENDMSKINAIKTDDDFAALVNLVPQLQVGSIVRTGLEQSLSKGYEDRVDFLMELAKTRAVLTLTAREASRVPNAQRLVATGSGQQ